MLLVTEGLFKTYFLDLVLLKGVFVLYLLTKSVLFPVIDKV